MLEAIIKAERAAQLGALLKHGIIIKDHSAFQDDKDFLYRVDAIISDEDIERLESEGYTVEIISNVSEMAKARLNEVSRTNRFSEVSTMADLKDVSAYKKYMNVEEIDEELIKLNKIYPDLVKLIQLPNKTWEKRTSRAIQVHTATTTDKPAVMFIGGVHAREWGTSDICMHFIRNLLDSYKKNDELKYGKKIFKPEQIKNIVENIDIIVFPDVNPDGKAFSQGNYDSGDPNLDQYVMWRKNRNKDPVPNPHPTDTGIHRTAGVDLNRNFGFLWNSGIGTEIDGRPISERYKGTEPFSEPESRNVKHLFDEYKNIKYFVDIHCHAGKILISWGEDETQFIYPEQNYRNPKYDGERGKLFNERGDYIDFKYREYMHPLDLHTLVNYATRMSDALTAVRGHKYIVESSLGLYPTSGSSQDYAFSQRVPDNGNRSRISAYTIEFGAPAESGDPEGHFIPEYKVMQKIMDDIASALTELCFGVASENNL